MARLQVTQIRSSIGTKPKQRGTLRALGLGRIGKTHVLEDTPDARGQINKVPHLVTVIELDAVTTDDAGSAEGSDSEQPDAVTTDDAGSAEGSDEKDPT